MISGKNFTCFWVQGHTSQDSESINKRTHSSP